METLSRYATLFIEYFSKVLLVLLVMIVSWIVFGRYVLSATPAWGEELAKILMVWIALTSASMAIRTDTHLRLSIIDFILPKKYMNMVHWVVLIMMSVFSIFFIIAGFQLVQLTSTNTLPGLRISSSWLYLAVPISGLAMLLQIIDKGRRML
ncbi:TRAP transporter small permease [Alkalihalobacillus oceani]|uniref:TRAP transporter small permease n=1 Tax=Halalkalibacter oceani TaxID=1653776 RepID=A0A9X2IQP5_9BACI|nr:TRAP transporter small permease [Halalkalibacter oceani]MCM3716076.1 TRAP transporter small permease [Halalkalibacter oceani]